MVMPISQRRTANAESMRSRINGKQTFIAVIFSFKQLEIP
jgi:hypothetical protein